MSMSHWGMLEVLLTEQEMKGVIAGKKPSEILIGTEQFGKHWGFLYL